MHLFYTLPKVIVKVLDSEESSQICLLHIAVVAQYTSDSEINV